jgi:hypothetical protein
MKSIAKTQSDHEGVHKSIGNWEVTQTVLAVYVFACGKFCLIEIISWFSKELGLQARHRFHGRKDMYYSI